MLGVKSVCFSVIQSDLFMCNFLIVYVYQKNNKSSHLVYYQIKC